jgi:eukaryotic-like serine/threonine-protein kinase
VPGLTAAEELRTRFVREARAISALNHPNIINIYDIDQVNGVDFIAMEYVEGRTLRSLMDTLELAVPAALDYTVQIARALVAAHSAGIIHRDIKPANIMITDAAAGARQVKVLDFGLAKLSHPSRLSESSAEDTTEGSILGTAAYMSPEQAEGKPMDARSDIFSLGAVLHEMLSGQRAFRGESNMAILASVLREEPAPLSGIPQDLQSIVLRCLSKDARLRFQSADEFKTALEACIPLAVRSTLPVTTIAVLPFANLSGDKENEYFSEGLTEEMINALTKVSGLRVTARTSAFALSGKGLDVREIGARLNVDHILDGSVRRSGNRLRVTAQLIKVTGGYHLWSESYDREIADVLAIQDELSKAIVETLRVHLIKGASLIKRHTSSTEAYSLYLRGRHYMEKHTPEGYAKARTCFDHALIADPKYTLPFLGLAEFHWQNAFYGYQFPKEALFNAKEAANRALENDGALPEGLALWGTLLGIADFNWRAADRAFQRAMELDKNSPYVLFRYANFYLWPQGRLDEAIALIERTLAYDPLSIVTHWVIGYYLYARREYDRAIKHLLAVIDMAPTFYLAYCVLGMAYVQLGMRHESIAALEKASKLCPGNPFTFGLLAYGLGKAGRIMEAGSIIEEIHSAAQHSYVPAKSLMFAWAGLGDMNKVLDLAEKSVDERDPMTVMNLRMEPALDPVRSNPRYLALLRNINLQS